MKKAILIIFCALVPTMAISQDGPRDRKYREEINELRKETFNQTLQLTADEATVFWPVYDQYQREKQLVNTERRTLSREMGGRGNELSNDEATRYMERMLELEQQELNLKRKFISEAQQKIPAVKVAQIPRAEREFKRVLLEQYRERAGERPQRSGRGPRE